MIGDILHAVLLYHNMHIRSYNELCTQVISYTGGKVHETIFKQNTVNDDIGPGVPLLSLQELFSDLFCLMGLQHKI